MSRPLVVVAGVPLAVIAGVVAFLLLLASTPAAAGICGPSGPGAVVDLASLPGGAVAGYSGKQLENAALIMNAGQSLGVNVKAQTIGVMTAMGESSLLVVDRGDAAGPDSRGLFQQRANGAWGSYSDRMDPTISATNFFKALTRVDGWESLPPTIAAHRVQRNSDPYHYVRFWDPAVAVVGALAGVAVTGVSEGTSDLACTGTTPGEVTAGGWTQPTTGPVTSSYGPRGGRMHNGTDIAPPCDTPIYAASGGTVVRAGPSSGYGNLIAIDHGAGVVTRYAHMFPDGVLARVGEKVEAGRQIGLVGTYGDSTGCHLHFEVMIGGGFTNPAPFMADKGAPLGSAAA